MPGNKGSQDCAFVPPPPSFPVTHFPSEHKNQQRGINFV